MTCRSIPANRNAIAKTFPRLKFTFSRPVTSHWTPPPMRSPHWSETLSVHYAKSCTGGARAELAVRSTANRFNHQLAVHMSPQNFGLRPRLGNFGQGLLFFFFFGLASKMVFGQAVAEEVEGVFGSVDEFKKV